MPGPRYFTLNLCTGTLGAAITNYVYVVCHREGTCDQDLHLMADFHIKMNISNCSLKNTSSENS